MPPRRRTPAAALALALAGALLAGCTADTGLRETGDAVTEAEAELLSRLLLRNHQRGGADFVATAPYGDDVVLTLTGEVDFRQGRARARLVTGYGDGRPDDTAELAADGERLWLGRDGDWEERPLADGGTAELVDVLARVVLNLGSARADDPAAFGDGDWTWQGRRSIDSRLSAVFAGPGGAGVAVDAADDLLLQYVTAVPGQSFVVTVTLSDHGRRSVELPGAAGS